MRTSSRKILLEPPWLFHEFQRQLLANPPDGYEFVAGPTSSTRLVEAAARWGFARSLLQAADAVIPTTLAKSLLTRGRTPPPDVQLTYAVDHLVFRPTPWVVEVEYACALLGNHAGHLRRFRHIARAALAAPACRRILCWSDAGRLSLADVGWDAFAHKIEVAHYAVPPQPFMKQYRDGPVKLLFIGSGSSVGAFDGRGSEIFEVFTALRELYPRLQLVVRSDVPAYLKRRYAGMDGVRILDQRVSREVLEQELRTADVFFLPCHYTLALTLLEAMSYELPVVTIDSWANAEYVRDGVTGLVASRSHKIEPFLTGTRQPNILARSFRRLVRVPDRGAVRALIRAVGRLVEDAELRRRLGKAGRREVEHGKFSMARLKAQLGRICDEAIDGGAKTRPA